MTTFENILSEETSRMEKSIGGWVAVANATLSHVVRFSPYTVTLDSDVQANSMRVTASAESDVEVSTEQVEIVTGDYYKSFNWLSGQTHTSAFVGARYYRLDGTMLQDTNTEFAPLSNLGWNGLWHISMAPENATFVESYIRILGMAADDEAFVSWPTVMQQSDITPNFVDYVLDIMPRYIIEADFEQAGYKSGVGAPTPLIRYVTLGSKQLSDTMADVTSWDYVSETFSKSGVPDYSSLVNPAEVDASWLPWLAQLLGVDLEGDSSGGRSPWYAFASQGIDTWTSWEEDVDPRSIPGVPDTEWVDIESYSPDYFDTESARRLQIASGFNGVLGGTSESITEYVGSLLNTDEEDPYVYVVKHYATNPYRILVAVLDTDDPDPSGETLQREVASAAPAGTSVVRKHGVSVTARTYYSVPEMLLNMSNDIDLGGGLLPVRFVENGSANGRHLTLGSVDASSEPFLGGGIALARWFPGFAFYSGAVEVATTNSSAYNILGDIDIRVLLSNVSIPTTNTVEIMASPNKWSLSVDTTGSLVFSWENTGTMTATSTVPVNWGSADKGPFWVRATLDVNNDASGHDVIFYTAPTLYEDEWDQVGETITTLGTTGIDSDAAASFTLLGNAISPAEDSVSALIYRAMVHDEIDGTVAVDIDLTGEVEFSETLVNTGTAFFKLPITNIRVDMIQAAQGAVGLTESLWTAQTHKGGDNYFYLGQSPYKYDSGNPAAAGDTLVASGLPSDTYDWSIRTRNNELITGSTGPTTTITWDSDVYGGESILSITVKETTGSTVKGFFTASLFEDNQTTNTDVYGVGWTFTRAWTDTGDFYEYSAFVDRDYVSPTFGAGIFDSGIAFDAEETITVAVSARRFWPGPGTNTIVNHISTSGWALEYSGDLIQARVTDGTTTVTLSYDEVAGGRLGTFFLTTLRRDVGSKEISLWIDDTMVDSAVDPFLDGGLFPVIGQYGYVGDAPSSPGFDLRYFGIFDRNLDGGDIAFLAGEMDRLTFLLPQAPQNVIPIPLGPTVVVPNIGLDWYNTIVIPATVDVSPTMHTPSASMSLIADYIATANVVHEPAKINMYAPIDHIATSLVIHEPAKINMYVPMSASIASTVTFYDFTSTGGA